MTRYAKIVANAVAEYPYTFAALRRDNPHVSFPKDPDGAWLPNYGVFPVAEAAQPAHDAINDNVVEGTPALVGGVWTQTWSVVPASAEEVAARQKAADDLAAKSAVAVDAFIANFVAMTPAQVTSYINSNLTDLASAKAIIGKLALMVLVLARREFTQ